MNRRPLASVHRRSTRDALFDRATPGSSVVAYSRSFTCLPAGRRNTFSSAIRSLLFAGSQKIALNPESDRGFT